MKCVVVITKEEKGFVATDFDTRVASQGKTVEDAIDNLTEALELYYEDSNLENRSPVYMTSLVEVSV